MSIKLTKKQKQILNFIEEYINEEGVSPTYREITAGLGLRSVSSVAEHVDNLVALGVLRRSPKLSRGLELVDLTFPETRMLFESRLANCSDEEAIILQKAALILGVDVKMEDEGEDE